MRPSEPPQPGAAFEGQGYEAPESSDPPAYESGPPIEPLGFPPPSSELPSMSGPQRPWGDAMPSANGVKMLECEVTTAARPPKLVADLVCMAKLNDPRPYPAREPRRIR